MNGHRQLATRAAFLALAAGALAVAFLLSHGVPTQSAGGLTITMTDAPDPVAPGGVVTYTITVTNGGVEAEENVIVEDVISGHGVIVDAAPSQGFCDFTQTEVLCVLGTIDPDASATVIVDKQAHLMMDVGVSGVTVDCPASAQVGIPFNCTVGGTVHNAGPSGPASADVTAALTTPFDCTKTPAGNQAQNDVSLPVSTNVGVSKSWTVTCSGESFHLFTANVTATLDTPGAADPNPGNNVGTGQDTTPVLAPDDVKATGVNVTAPSSATPGSAFTVSIAATVHNNGPLATVQGEGGVGLAVPGDCSLTPAGVFQLFNPITLPASTAVVQTRTWDVTCTGTGEHAMIACGRAAPVTEHVFDPTVTNNFARLDFSVDVGAGSPAVPTGVNCSIPGDPPEVCDNGIDDDQDGLIDEQPDTDNDGASDCVDDDDDGDAYSDALEASIGTDPRNACPNHPYDSAWPPDFDNGQSVNIGDVLALKPVFGSSPGQGTYQARRDLDASGSINISDVLKLKPVFGQACTP